MDPEVVDHMEHVDTDTDIDDAYDSQDDRAPYNDDAPVDNIADKMAITAPHWGYIVIQGVRVYVSNKGHVVCPYHRYITMGSVKTGTPYREVAIILDEDNIIVRDVHSLVWEAFNGRVPNGYEVRHAWWVTSRGYSVYPNDVDSLEIYRVMS